MALDLFFESSSTLHVYSKGGCAHDTLGSLENVCVLVSRFLLLYPDVSLTLVPRFSPEALPRYSDSAIILHNFPDRLRTLTEREEVEMIRPPLV